MSNLIKYPFVNMQGKDKFIVDYEKKEEDFVPLQKSSRVKIRSVEEVEQEAVASAAEEATSGSEFSPGVPVMNFDEMLSEKQEEAKQEAEKIISEAKKQAAALLTEAENQVEQIRQKAHEEGIEDGKAEGIAKAEEELSAIRQELEDEKANQKQEYENLIAGVEGHYVEVLCSLIQKITGVLISDNKDVLLHLIRSGIADMTPANSYTIRVSSEDVLLVEGHKEEIRNKAGITAMIEVQEEKSLEKDDCIIETDTQMVDCGFRTQLDNLVNTLRMIAQ
ncbi:MAG: hypothetical protein J1F22_03340 [Lachnospiraceae bacterium]|nr:hypothetical protein [Lachnospiraceae bacterium]